MDVYFSIVMPIYKTEKVIIERAIKSVENQIFKNWELIIVDDNPKNSEYKNIVRYLSEKNRNDKISFIIQENNRGANAARNEGVKHSKGMWCAFIDADDEWMEDYLKNCKNILDNDHSVGLVSSSYIIVTRGRKVTISSDFTRGNYYKQELMDDIVSPTSAVIVKKENLEMIGGFDESLPARQDYDTWLRVSKFADFASNNRPSVYIYRNGHESISTNYMNHVHGTLKVLEKIKSQIPEQEYLRIKEYHYLHIAEYCIQFSDYELASEYARKCSKSNRKTKIMLVCRLRRVHSIYRGFGRKIISFFHQ